MSLANGTLFGMVTRKDPGVIEQYREGLHERERQERELALRRHRRAWEVARELAGILRSQYGATRVVVFGSLLSESMFTMQSDIDVATWGICAEASMRAMGEAMDLDGEFDVQLVFSDSCSSALLVSIESEGMEI